MAALHASISSWHMLAAAMRQPEPALADAPACLAQLIARQRFPVHISGSQYDDSACAVKVGVYLLTLVLLGVQTLQECLALVNSSQLSRAHHVQHAVLWKLRMYLRAVAAGQTDIRRHTCPAFVAEAASNTFLTSILDSPNPEVRRAA